MIGRYTFPGPSETEALKAWKSMDSQLRDGWFLVASAPGPVPILSAHSLPVLYLACFNRQIQHQNFHRQPWTDVTI